MARELVNGEVRGYRWFELPREAYGDIKGLRGDQTAPVVTVLVPPDDYPSDERISDFFSPKYGKTFQRSLTFTLVDEAVDLPGRLIGYGYAHGHSIRNWAKARFPVPDGIQVDFHYPDYRPDGNLVLEATTEKDGRVVKVRKKVERGEIADIAIPKLFEWFLKNAPKPSGDAGATSCGAHVAEILKSATAGAVEMIREWERTKPESRPNRTIPGDLLPDTGVDALTLKTTRTSNAVQTEITLKGGHTLKDDKTGITIEIKAQIPETLVNAVKGETLGAVFDASWARLITIRSASATASDAVQMRGYAKGAPFVLPDPVEMEEETARDIIRRVASGGSIRNLAESVLEKIVAMTPQEAATALLAIASHESYDLAAHGHPGWSVWNSAGWVTLTSTPMHKPEDLLEAFA